MSKTVIRRIKRTSSHDFKVYDIHNFRTEAEQQWLRAKTKDGCTVSYMPIVGLSSDPDKQRPVKTLNLTKDNALEALARVIINQTRPGIVELMVFDGSHTGDVLVIYWLYVTSTVSAYPNTLLGRIQAYLTHYMQRSILRKQYPTLPI